ncbi:molybdopterin-dependent oxidoreductase [Mycolicibacterium neoaurum]|uniref:molybdopterin-dependent oxidoreductase n=1 Tax=Mycolicibacterium neoaurum TaxID=1795 RepID=UPI0030840F63
MATVDDGDVVTLRPDPDHPNSQGFACSKGIAFPAVREDPDRVLAPMRRQPDGTFTEVGWDEALDDIGRRLRATISQHGRESVGLYQGNSAAFNYGQVQGRGVRRRRVILRGDSSGGQCRGGGLLFGRGVVDGA